MMMTAPHFHSLKSLRLAAAKGRKIIKQNLFWAFFYNCIGIGLAAAGLLTPLFAAIAMVLSSLIVILNAHRLSRMDDGR
jgi:Cu2+-exporting ATPase